MVSKATVISMLFLRIVVLASSAATLALLITNKVTFDDGSKLRFQDFKGYRYEAMVALVAGAYCIVQLPFAIYYAVKQKRFLRNGLPEYDFYADKVMSLYLATGVGVGFAVSLEFKRFFDQIFDAVGTAKNDPTRTTYDKFFDREIVATVVLLVACLSMVIVSIISSINLSRGRGLFNK